MEQTFSTAAGVGRARRPVSTCLGGRPAASDHYSVCPVLWKSVCERAVGLRGAVQGARGSRPSSRPSPLLLPTLQPRREVLWAWVSRRPPRPRGVGAAHPFWNPLIAVGSPLPGKGPGSGRLQISRTHAHTRTHTWGSPLEPVLGSPGGVSAWSCAGCLAHAVLCRREESSQALLPKQGGGVRATSAQRRAG